jgi:Secretion system C-terminal sorting domain/Pregnancy-associated plasma protein-A
MKTNLPNLLLLILLISTMSSYGQLPCGQKPMTPTQRQDIFLQREAYDKTHPASSARKTATSISDTSITFMPLRAHIVRKNKEGLSLKDLNNGLAITNKHFREAGNGIQFFLAGTSPNYIEDSTYYDYDAGRKDATGKTEEERITAKYGVRNAINVYFSNSVKTGGHGTDVGGYAYFPDTAFSTNHVFMVNGQSNDNITLPHELGHYLQLGHTFDGSADAEPTNREFVTRNKKETKHNRKSANCATNGDLICDTPADPYDRIKSFFKGCSYDVPATKIADINDDVYTPQMNNIMAYFQCGTYIFTPQQLEVMGGVALKKRLDTKNKYVVSGLNAWQFEYVVIPTIKKPTADSTGVIIKWQDDSNNETGFFVERATAKNGPFYAIGGVEPNETSFVDKGVVANQKYYYRVKPSNTTLGSLSEVDSIDVLITPKSGRIGAELSSTNLAENQKQLSVFPNPTNGQEFYVRALNDIENATISMYSMIGQRISINQKTIDAQTASLRPLQKLTSGVYLIVSESENRVNAVKVVVE